MWTVQGTTQRAIWPEQMNTLGEEGKCPGKGLGRDEQGLEGREEKCQLCSREMKVCKLGKGKC